MTDTKSKEPDAAPWDIVDTLRKQAVEIAREGHNGWGITMIVAADEIERLRISPSAHGKGSERKGQDDGWRRSP